MKPSSKFPNGAKYTLQIAPARYRLKMLFLFACGISLGLFFGRRLVDASSNDTRLCQQDDTTFNDPISDSHSSSRKRRRRAIIRPFLIKPDELYVAKDEEAERLYLKEQANGLIDDMLMRVSATDLSRFGANVEATANGIYSYQKGLLDGIIRTAPELADDLAERIDQTFCDPNAKDSHLVSLAQLIQIMPELANEKGLDCIFSKRGDKEDFVLWSMMDAWMETGLPKTDALAQIENSATDERTRQRFSDQERISQEALEIENKEVL